MPKRKEKKHRPKSLSALSSKHKSKLSFLPHQREDAQNQIVKHKSANCISRHQKDIDKKKLSHQENMILSQSNSIIPSETYQDCQSNTNEVKPKSRSYSYNSGRKGYDKKVSNQQRLSRQALSRVSGTIPAIGTRANTSYATTNPSSLNRASRLSRKRIHSNTDRFQRAKSIAEKAIQFRKIFCICGRYPLIRRSLRQRGWVEKEFKALQKKALKDSDYDDDDEDLTEDISSLKDYSSESDEEIDENYYGLMARLVRNETAMFQWTIKTASIDWKCLSKDQIVNHYSRANFTTKVGLCLNLRSLGCFADQSADHFFPRCYRLCNEEEKEEFVDDYRMVAATSILRILVERKVLLPVDDVSNNTSDEIDRAPSSGKSNFIPVDTLLSALSICETYVCKRKHEDIDLIMPEILESNYSKVLAHHNKLVHEGACIADVNDEQIKRIQKVLEKIKLLHPQYTIDGIKNTWIIKPGAKSRGRGIVVMNNLEEIMKLVVGDLTLKKESRWVVQKYIERPLLIHKTKFDIRQWFLVTDWNPLTIWFYKECYLRLSSKPFNLSRLEPSVHLCNYSIQKNYENDAERDPMLPQENMLSDKKFIEHLNEQGYKNVWNDKIVSRMKEAVICVCQTAQDTVEYRKNSFELYGADFILDEDLNAWLIEVNSSPAMSRSTAVTRRICKMVQEDVIKVVLDRRKDKNCDTGLFEVIYKQTSVEVPLYVGRNLSVEGKLIQKPIKKRTINIQSAVDPASKIKPRPPSIIRSPSLKKISHTNAKASDEVNLVKEEPSNNKYTGNEKKAAPASIATTFVSSFNDKQQGSKSQISYNQQQQSATRLATNFSRKQKSKNLNISLDILVDIHKTTSEIQNSFSRFQQASTTKQNVSLDEIITTTNRFSSKKNQPVTPKLLPASVVAGGDVSSSEITVSRLKPPNCKVLTPQTIGLSLPFEKFFAKQNPNICFHENKMLMRQEKHKVRRRQVHGSFGRYSTNPAENSVFTSVRHASMSVSTFASLKTDFIHKQFNDQAENKLSNEITCGHAFNYRLKALGQPAELKNPIDLRQNSHNYMKTSSMKTKEVVLRAPILREVVQIDKKLPSMKMFSQRNQTFCRLANL